MSLYVCYAAIIVSSFSVCPSGRYNSGLTSLNITCTECQPGRYADKAGFLSECAACEQGFYSNVTARSTLCTACPAGLVGADLNRVDLETSCLNCPPGRFSADAGNAGCSSCPRGKFGSKDQGRACEECEAGTYGPQIGMVKATTACQNCPGGKFGNNTGQPSCRLCRAGTFSNKTKSTGCNPATCAPGKFTPAGSVSATDSCVLCLSGFYSRSGANTTCKRSQCVLGYNSLPGATTKTDKCQACPRGQYISATMSNCEATQCEANEASCPGAISPTDQCLVRGCAQIPNSIADDDGNCACTASFYLKTNNDFSQTCEICPLGADCSVAGSTLTKMPMKPGYWRSSNLSLEVLKCPAFEACSGNQSEDRGLCAEGNRGPLCMICEPGYYRPEVGSACATCGRSGGTGFYVLAILGSVLSFFGLVGYLNEQTYKGDMLEKLKELRDAEDAAGSEDLSAAGSEDLSLPGRYCCCCSSSCCSSCWRWFKQSFWTCCYSIAWFYYGIRTVVRFIGQAYDTTAVKVVLIYYQVASSLISVYIAPFPPVFKWFLDKIALLSVFDVFHVAPVKCAHPSHNHFDSLLVATLWPFTYFAIILLFYLLARLSEDNIKEKYERLSRKNRKLVGSAQTTTAQPKVMLVQVRMTSGQDRYIWRNGEVTEIQEDGKVMVRSEGREESQEWDEIRSKYLSVSTFLSYLYI